MNKMALEATVMVMSQLRDLKQWQKQRVSASDSDRGASVVAYLLVILMVIAVVAVVRPILIQTFADEAGNVDLDLSDGDPAVGG